MATFKSSAGKKRSLRQRDTRSDTDDNDSTATGAAAGSSSSTTTADGSADTVPIAVALEEARELQKMRKRTAGITAEKLMETVVERPATPKQQEDPFRLKTGGLVELPEGEKSLNLNAAFTQQTNSLDVDRHMVAYVEQEMRKRRGTDPNQAKNTNVDPMAELYKLPEIVKKPTEAREDNMAVSASMLTAIPEIDLGIDTKLKNIEETERARKAFEEQQKMPTPVAPPVYTEHDKRFAKTGGIPGVNSQNSSQATDALVLERFKQRQMMYRRKR